MTTGPRQVQAMARKTGRQRQDNMFLHDLIRFLDSIAEYREEYTRAMQFSRFPPCRQGGNGADVLKTA
jgi:hypothetical protein